MSYLKPFVGLVAVGLIAAACSTMGDSTNSATTGMQPGDGSGGTGTTAGVGADAQRNSDPAGTPGGR